jgi:YVTN family beta-propeller protein
MEFRILGPVEAADGGRTLPLAGGKARALLALLLLNANEVLSSDRIVDELWGERPPPTAAKIVQNAVSQLRRTLGDGRLETRGRGYVFQLAPGELDLDRFEQLVDRGRRAASPDQAARALREALELWRGAPLSDVDAEPFARDAVGRLVERRLVALEERIDADLVRGEHADLVGELESLVAQHPFRERLRGQLILALYRAGRQAEALAAYQAARRTLVDELGIEPGPALQELEKAILVQDPALDAPVRRRAPSVRARRRPLLAAVALLAAGGLAAGLFFGLRGSSSPSPAAVVQNSVAVIDPRTNRVVADVPVGLRPSGVAAGEDAVWVANEDASTVSRIDPKSRKVTDTIRVGAHATDIAVGSGAVGVANGDDETVTRIDSRFDSVQDSIDLGAGGALEPQPVFAVATGDDGVWVTSGAHQVLRIDPKTDANVSSTTVALSPLALAFGDGALWVASAMRLSRIEPATNAVTASAPVPGAAAIAAGNGYLWLIVPGELHGEVWRFDPSSISPTATVQVGVQPSAIAIGDDGSVWVANSGDGTVSRVEPLTATVVTTITLGERPTGIALGGGKVWVTVDRPE